MVKELTLKRLQSLDVIAGHFLQPALFVVLCPMLQKVKLPEPRLVNRKIPAMSKELPHERCGVDVRSRFIHHPFSLGNDVEIGRYRMLPQPSLGWEEITRQEPREEHRLKPSQS